MSVLGGCLAFIIFILDPAMSVHPASYTTPLCVNSAINRFVAAATIIPLINDSFVFLAISWRLTRNAYDQYTLENGIRFLIFGDYLPVFSKVLLKDGQAYYLLALS